METQKHKTNGPKLSVRALIPAYNEAELIGKTIPSLQNQSCPVEKILVVDDSFTDETADIASKTGAEVVRTPSNKGTKAQAQDYGLQLVNTNLAINV